MHACLGSKRRSSSLTYPIRVLGLHGGGRLFCKQDIQMGSIPIRSIRVSSESANAVDCKSALFGGNGLDTHLAH